MNAVLQIGIGSRSCPQSVNAIFCIAWVGSWHRREDILRGACGLARANAGAPGVDRVSFAEGRQSKMD